ncbi:hypothetical protein SAMN05720487_11428 [Fibrobacter sp. UWT2]|uniref:hypothetical protein n=1 Tax=Fibrobacter sp. UWT2 TaxID=1896224 RepID=UPI000918922C|nr:hypothetical protein [Fibrobacter sp. UWT2]SHL45003.1 hypothetical protein SAMN05720487_11428 [Fibrobacter sp. UWT2]
MNNKVLATATVVVLSSFISSAWAARPEGEPTCSFVGGAFYKSNNTMYLESINDENAKVEVDNVAANCINNSVSGNFKVIVERSTALAANSTITLPANYQSANECVDLYEPISYNKDENGMWITAEKHDIENGAAHRPMLMITNTDKDECKGIKEIEFTATGVSVSTQTSVELALRSDVSNQGDWLMRGSYSFIRWDKDDAELGSVYGYAAKTKDKVEAGQFTKVGSGAFVPPLRAYLVYKGDKALQKSTESVASALPETINVKLIDKGNGTTRLARWNMATGEIVKVNGWFDLKGRKLNSKPQNKGMFIGNTKVQK